jgi:hypothetical protein
MQNHSCWNEIYKTGSKVYTGQNIVKGKKIIEEANILK